MVDFYKYKENKEQKSKNEIHGLIEKKSEENKNLMSLINQYDLAWKNGSKPSDKVIDEMFESMKKLYKTDKEIDEKLGFSTGSVDEIFEGAAKMAEENELHIVK